ncbi:MAG: 3-hydroxyacyl-CoA dehydrogenase NAD-binding domain-containing protein, partial [Pseudomonadota bacterium]
MNTIYNHWEITEAENQIVYLTIHCKNSSSNVLSQQVLNELDKILDHITKSNFKTVVFRSTKPGVFIAGADVHEFTQIKTQQDALHFIRFGQSVMNKISNLPMTSISLIDGYCLGGGLELALACNFIVLSDSEKVRLGFPEVKLGIHPGYGGSVRSIKRMGVLKAMDLMLSGRFISAFIAKKMGLADAIIPQRHINNSNNISLILQQQQKNRQRNNQLLELPLIKDFIAWLLKKRLSRHIKAEHYPAPFQLITQWRDNYGDMQSRFNSEAESASQLLMSETAQNLIRVFHLQEQLKKAGQQVKISARHVHIMGAGIMGSDIAIWCVHKGYRVSVFDLSENMLAKMIQKAHQFFSKKYRKAHQIQHAMDRLIADPNNLGVEKADVLIEAIIEKISAKQQLFSQIENRVTAECLLLTNTSSIMLEEISSSMKQPQRLVGLHFFNPVAKMPLIEVISGEKTDPQLTQSACAFAGSIAKLPLVVKSSPGFLVNRILMPYLLEAMNLVAEGVKPSSIDQAAINFGMPMGPIELADKVGLDICLHVATLLAKPLEITIPQQLIKLVEEGKLGIKSS